MAAREALRQTILRNLGLLIVSGTVEASPAPSSTVFAVSKLAGKTSADVTGRWMAVTNGSNPGESRIASLSGTTLTLHYALPGAPASGDKVEVYDVFSKTDVDEAISMAINSVRGLFLVPKFDRTSLTIAASTYEYAVPSGFDFISKLTVQTTTSPSEWDTVIPDLQWELINVAGVATIKLLADWPLSYADKTIEIVGANYPAAPSTDAGTNPIEDSYVVNWCSWHLGTRMPLGETSAGWNARVNEWLNVAREYLMRNARTVTPSARRVPTS